MNPQKLVLVIGLIAFGLCVLYPPWMHTIKHGGTYSEQNAGYHRLDKPPSPKIKHFAAGVKMDTARLTTQLVGVSAGTLILWLIVSPRRRDSGGSAASGNS